MYVYPAPDRLVRDPDSRRIVGPEGIDIDPTDPSWHRLLSDGDVIADPPAVEASTLPAPTARPTNKE